MEDIRIENMEQYKSIDIQKQCYVYPAGGCAKACVNILKDCFLDVEWIMLDDSQEETSLEAFCEVIIASGQALFLCAGDIQEELLEKCRKYGITNVIDGRVYVANLLAQKIKQEAQLCHQKFEILENGRVLHIFENPWITHFYYFYDIFAYYLDDTVFIPLREACLCYCCSLQVGKFLELKSGIFLTFCEELLRQLILQKEDVVVYCGNLKGYASCCHRIPLECKILICPWILVDFFINRSVCFSAGSLMFPLKDYGEIVKVGVGHSLCEAYQFFPKRQKLEYLRCYIKRYFLGFDYYLALDQQSKESFEWVFKECGVLTQILEGGSLSLDTKGVCFSDDVENFMFIPRLNGAECAGVIEALLDLGKKVVVRLHPAVLAYSCQYGFASPYSYLDDFIGHRNFSIDKTHKIHQGRLANSIVITDNSSLSYSAPLSTLRPSILFCPPKKEFDLRVRNFGMSFENPILHRVALSVEECVQSALNLERELAAGGGAYLREKIKKYRDENLYHQGCAAKEIARILKEILEGKI